LTSSDPYRTYVGPHNALNIRRITYVYVVWQSKQRLYLFIDWFYKIT